MCLKFSKKITRKGGFIVHSHNVTAIEQVARFHEPVFRGVGTEGILWETLWFYLNSKDF
jgi:hypothetical protein